MEKETAARAQPGVGKLQGLQVLRGFAALLVVWCHLKYNLGFGPGVVPAQLSSWLTTDLGAIGVDIFFVISGYVITMTAANFGRDWRIFLANRIARVVPLYFLVSFVCLVLVLFPVSGMGIQNFQTVFNTFEFLPVFDRGGFTNPLCSNGWTLSFEMWFYVLFAGVMARVGQRAGKVLPVILAAGVVVIGGIYRCESWFLPKFLFHPLTLEFCAGCLLYHCRDWMGRRALFTFCGLLPILLYWSNHDQTLGKHLSVIDNVGLGLLRTGVWGGFAICLVGVVTQVDLKYRLSWPGALLRLGDASYSIYLVSPLILPLTRAVMWLFTRDAHLSMPVYGLIYLVGSVGGGLLLWRFVETPATQWAKRSLTESVRRSKNGTGKASNPISTSAIPAGN